MNKSEEREAIILENNGQKIFGIMHVPKNQQGPMPAVLICHGLAGHKTGRFRLYVDLAQELSKAGIAAFRFDFRGSGDSEGEFSDITVNSQVSDAIKALEFLGNYKNVDPSNLGLFGRSFGGAIAIMTANRHGGVKSIALWAPFYTPDPWKDQWRIVQSPDTSPHVKDELMRINGQLGSFEFFKQFFNLKLEGEIQELDSTALLHIHGEKDARLTANAHAQGYMQCRKNAKGQTRFITLPNSDHDFSNPDEREYAVKETTAWFGNTL